MRVDFRELHDGILSIISIFIAQGNKTMDCYLLALKVMLRTFIVTDERWFLAGWADAYSGDRVIIAAHKITGFL